MRKTAVIAGLLVLATAAVPSPASASSGNSTLFQYAKDTWRSMAAMVDPATGIPSDKVTGDLKTRAKVTSPTNIGTYLWSTLVARDLRVIASGEATARVGKVLDALERMDRD